MPETVRYLPFSDNSAKDIPSIICLGNFDGVHKGHLALLDGAQRIRSDLSRAGQNVRVGILCFDTLSSDHFSKDRIPRLMDTDKKLKFLQDCGIDFAYVCDFSEIKDLSPVEFIDDILIKKCSCIGAICGFNFRFGKKAAGTAEFLVEHFEKRMGRNDTCLIVPPVMIDTDIISSSHIRELLSEGNIEGANDMLGRHFSIEHEVVHGKHLGTQLGFPTINHVFSDTEIIPAFGIYATKTAINGESFQSVTNIGTRPTVSSSGTVTCETHIIGIDGESRSFYGQKAEVFFYKKLRDEKRFSSPDELSAAISEDVIATKKYFSINGI